MRVQDVITENTKIDEAPAGILSQVGRRLGAKALGAIGFKGKAAELTGKADVGAEANKLMTDFRGYLGKTGGNIKQVQGPQLAAFLKSKGYPNMHLKDVQGVMTTKQVDQAVLKAAQDAAVADGDPAAGTGTTSSTAATTKTGGGSPSSTATPAKSSGTTKGTAQTPSASTTGSPQAGAASQSATGTVSAQPKTTPAQSNNTSAGIPPALLKKITSLTAQEKKQLAGML